MGAFEGEDEGVNLYMEREPGLFPKFETLSKLPAKEVVIRVKKEIRMLNFFM
jgi:hypothetical protein